MKRLRSSWVIWYAFFMLIVILFGYAICLLSNNKLPELTLLTLATTATTAIALASTNYHEYESKRNMKLLRWLFNTEFSTSLQYLVVTIYATLLAFAALRELLANIPIINAIDMALNIAVWIMIIGFLYWAIHITGKSRV